MDDSFEAQLIESSFDRFVEVSSGGADSTRIWLRASEIEALADVGAGGASVLMSSGHQYLIEQSPADIVAAIQNTAVVLPTATVTVLPGGRG